LLIEYATGLVRRGELDYTPAVTEDLSVLPVAFYHRFEKHITLIHWPTELAQRLLKIRLLPILNYEGRSLMRLSALDQKRLPTGHLLIID